MNDVEGEDRHPRLFSDISIHTGVSAHTGVYTCMHICVHMYEREMGMDRDTYKNLTT